MQLDQLDSDTIEGLTSQGYNRIPVVKTILADLETPLSIYFKLANQPYSYLFESVQGGEKWGRYSFIGLPCKTIIKVKHHHISVFNEGHQDITLSTDKPLDWIKDFQNKFKAPELPDLPRFNGGLVGYFGYDIIRSIEPKLAGSMPAADPLDVPDIVLMVSDEFVVFDNLLGQLSIVVMVDPFQNQPQAFTAKRFNEIETKLSLPLPHNYYTAKPNEDISPAEYQLEFPEPDYKHSVQQIKNYIKDGEVMQVVLSQRMTRPFETEAINLYRTLRRLNPSPYHYYLDLEDFYIVGSSPEILVRKDRNIATVRPIAGTRKRGADDSEDIALEQELLADKKERAEHLMLIDLGRNDIGRIAKPGTVKLTESFVIERYSHVMHIVSNVIGEVKDDLRAIDVLEACFPAGTVSGAPKVRAMEILDQFEPIKRGVYSGAIGYIAWNDNMDVAIAIRTAVIKDNQVSIQAGGGIVADSTPEFEWQESLNKAKVIQQAVELAEQGFK